MMRVQLSRVYIFGSCNTVHRAGVMLTLLSDMRRLSQLTAFPALSIAIVRRPCQLIVLQQHLKPLPELRISINRRMSSKRVKPSGRIDIGSPAGPAETISLQCFPTIET